MTVEERQVAFKRRAFDFHEKVRGAMKEKRADNTNPVAYTQGVANSIHEAIYLIVIEMFALAMVERERLAELERRIADLEEAATKP